MKDFLNKVCESTALGLLSIEGITSSVGPTRIGWIIRDEVETFFDMEDDKWKAERTRLLTAVTICVMAASVETLRGELTK